MSIPKIYIDYTYYQSTKIPSFDEVLQEEYKIESLRHVSTGDTHSILSSLQYVLYRTDEESTIDAISILECAFESFNTQMINRAVHSNHPGLLFCISDVLEMK